MSNNFHHTSPKPAAFETAAEHASSRIPVVAPASRVEQIWAAISGKDYECATHIVVCDNGKFRGLLKIEDLLAAHDESTASELMDHNPPIVVPGVDQELIMFPFVFWRWGDPEVALGVSLSLLAACSTATIAAMLFPWIFDRLGLDPAFGSGPLATIVQDLSSILIYFVIVTSLV
jgi:Mg/Co/Ni transporter MgtE